MEKMVKAKSLINFLSEEELKLMDIKRLISIQVMKIKQLLDFYRSTNTTLKGYVDAVKCSDLISEHRNNILEFNKIKKFIEKK